MYVHVRQALGQMNSGPALQLQAGAGFARLKSHLKHSDFGLEGGGNAAPHLGVSNNGFFQNKFTSHTNFNWKNQIKSFIQIWVVFSLSFFFFEWRCYCKLKFKLMLFFSFFGYSIPIQFHFVGRRVSVCVGVGG